MMDKDGIYWCDLCGDRPATHSCEDCHAGMCGFCQGLHICSQ